MVLFNKKPSIEELMKENLKQFMKDNITAGMAVTDIQQRFPKKFPKKRRLLWFLEGDTIECGGDLKIEKDETHDSFVELKNLTIRENEKDETYEYNKVKRYKIILRKGTLKEFKKRYRDRIRKYELEEENKKQIEISKLNEMEKEDTNNFIQMLKITGIILGFLILIFIIKWLLF